MALSTSTPKPTRQAFPAMAVVAYSSSCGKSGVWWRLSWWGQAPGAVLLSPGTHQPWCKVLLMLLGSERGGQKRGERQRKGGQRTWTLPSQPDGREGEDWPLSSQGLEASLRHEIMEIFLSIIITPHIWASKILKSQYDRRHSAVVSTHQCLCMLPRQGGSSHIISGGLVNSPWGLQESKFTIF